jgi:hypothetical protein
VLALGAGDAVRGGRVLQGLIDDQRRCR